MSRGPSGARLSDAAAVGFLGYDLIQLAALLYLTGGLQNPFALLFIGPVLGHASWHAYKESVGGDDRD